MTRDIKSFRCFYSIRSSICTYSFPVSISEVEVEAPRSLPVGGEDVHMKLADPAAHNPVEEGAVGRNSAEDMVDSVK